MLNMNMIWQSGMNGASLVVIGCAIALYAICAVSGLMAVCSLCLNCIKSRREDACMEGAQETPDALAVWLACGPIHS